MDYSRSNKRKIPLRVCWISKGGTNCCNCEKCWRTILGVYAEGENPRNYGFNYSDKQLSKLAFKMRFGGDRLFGPLRYSPIQNAMKQNTTKEELPSCIRWFYDIDLSNLKQSRWWYKLLMRIRNKVYRMVKTR